MNLKLSGLAYQTYRIATWTADLPDEGPSEQKTTEHYQDATGLRLQALVPGRRMPGGRNRTGCLDGRPEHRRRLHHLDEEVPTNRAGHSPDENDGGRRAGRADVEGPPGTDWACDLEAWKARMRRSYTFYQPGTGLPD